MPWAELTLTVVIASLANDSTFVWDTFVTQVSRRFVGGSTVSGLVWHRWPYLLFGNVFILTQTNSLLGNGCPSKYLHERADCCCRSAVFVKKPSSNVLHRTNQRSSIHLPWAQQWFREVSSPRQTYPKRCKNTAHHRNPTAYHLSLAVGWGGGEALARAYIYVQYSTNTSA